MKGLESADKAESDDLGAEPPAGSDTVEQKIRRKFEEHDTKTQKLLAYVELILYYPYVLEL